MLSRDPDAHDHQTGSLRRLRQFEPSMQAPNAGSAISAVLIGCKQDTKSIATTRRAPSSHSTFALRPFFDSMFESSLPCTEPSSRGQ
ncbi:hypothetical protein M3J09_007642 [Ascochyta lentis]